MVSDSQNVFVSPLRLPEKRKGQGRKTEKTEIKAEQNRGQKDGGRKMIPVKKRIENMVLRY